MQNPNQDAPALEFLALDFPEPKSQHKVGLQMAMVGASGLLGGALVLGLVQVGKAKWHPFTQKDQSNPAAQVHPAIVPFKQTQAACEKSGRLWQNGQCFDHGHDPSF
jgi:hypothetical protein